MKTALSKRLATWSVSRQKQWISDAEETQLRVLRQLLYQARKTQFAREHDLVGIHAYEDYKARVPIRDYESFAPYIAKIQAGEKDVLWPGRPMYWAKTAGTISGSKHIPITKDSLPHHLTTARHALYHYIHTTGNADFVRGSMVFLSGSPQLVPENGIPTGRLSGIVNHHIPSYLKRQKYPKYATNCIQDWEQKLDAIVEETLKAPVTLISGIPPWVQMYMDKLQQRSGSLIKDLFPRLSLLVHGGVNFAPYSTKLFDTIGQSIDTIETYPASEGFIAFQDAREAEGMLLQLNSGMFFEFVPVKEIHSENPTRRWLQDVALGADYALVLSTNAGLWSYVLGDTVQVASRSPYRIVVTGRVNQYTSAFGEHVIAEEVDRAIKQTLKQYPEVSLTEFTVAPQVSQQAGEASYHEWLIEFERPPKDIASFTRTLDEAMRRLNIYYDDLVRGNTLQPLRITQLGQGTFRKYMKAHNKLGEQNKVTRLSNDRKVASGLLATL